MEPSFSPSLTSRQARRLIRQTVVPGLSSGGVWDRRLADLLIRWGAAHRGFYSDSMSTKHGGRRVFQYINVFSAWVEEAPFQKFAKKHGVSGAVGPIVFVCCKVLRWHLVGSRIVFHKDDHPSGGSGQAQIQFVAEVVLTLFSVRVKGRLCSVSTPFQTPSNVFVCC